MAPAILFLDTTPSLLRSLLLRSELAANLVLVLGAVALNGWVMWLSHLLIALIVPNQASAWLPLNCLFGGFVKLTKTACIFLLSSILIRHRTHSSMASTSVQSLPSFLIHRWTLNLIMISDNPSLFKVPQMRCSSCLLRTHASSN